MTPGALHVLCGLPGSGKSTLACQLAQAVGGNACVVSAGAVVGGHDMGARQAFVLHGAVGRGLARGNVVVVDSCALLRFERAALLAMGRRAAASCTLHVLTTPWDVCRLRDRARPHPSGVYWPGAVERLRIACRGAQAEGWDDVRYHDGGDAHARMA